MTDILVRIKRAVLTGHYVFSEKARLEMEADGLRNSILQSPSSMP